MERLFVKYGAEKRYFDLPPGWKNLTFATFQEHTGRDDVERLARTALDRPIGSKPLKDLLSPKARIAILIEDKTRSSPKKIILKVLLETLARIGVARENISVVVALGTHAPQSPAEMADLYGEDTVRDYAFFNHDCKGPDLVPVSKLKSGTPVKINRRVAEADFKIGLGSIFPHPMAGFGGGCKILFPGVADFDSILEHHLQYCLRNGSDFGVVEENPFYNGICEHAQAAGLNFILNTVLDYRDGFYDLVCGDPVKAQTAGIEVCKSIVTRRFPKRADLTVISSFPYTEGPQVMKPLAPASIITRKGGIIILVAHSTSTLPEFYLAACDRFRMQHKGRIKEGVFELFDNQCRILEEGSPELNMAMAQSQLVGSDHKVILVSDEFPRKAAERMGFLFAGSLEEAFAMSGAFVTNPEVHVVPFGGVILPEVVNVD
jgi:lactate racemase